MHVTGGESRKLELPEESPPRSPAELNVRYSLVASAGGISECVGGNASVMGVGGVAEGQC